MRAHQPAPASTQQSRKAALAARRGLTPAQQNEIWTTNAMNNVIPGANNPNNGNHVIPSTQMTPAQQQEQWNYRVMNAVTPPSNAASPLAGIHGVGQAKVSEDTPFGIHADSASSPIGFGSHMEDTPAPKDAGGVQRATKAYQQQQAREAAASAAMEARNAQWAQLNSLNQAPVLDAATARKNVAAKYNPQIAELNRQAQFSDRQGTEAVADISNVFGLAQRQAAAQARGVVQDTGALNKQLGQSLHNAGALGMKGGAKSQEGSFGSYAANEMGRNGSQLMRQMGSATAAAGAFASSNAKTKFANQAADFRNQAMQQRKSMALESSAATQDVAQQNFTNQQQVINTGVALQGKQAESDPNAQFRDVLQSGMTWQQAVQAYANDPIMTARLYAAGVPTSMNKFAETYQANAAKAASTPGG